ncbi:MAG: HpnA protein [Planctomycetaceae bacterium]|nr:HpnA protein [Planctomycetaceae bacterium]
MTILVTGATGLLGNNVVRLLGQRGLAVRALVRKSADPRPLEGLDVDVVPGDLRDHASLERSCQGVSAVVHAAAFVAIGRTQRDLAESINVEGTRALADAARDVGAKMVHVSSVDALAPATPQRPADETTAGSKPACPYVVTKRSAEAVIRKAVESGLEGTIVNPAFMLGPWDWKPSSGRMLLEVARRFSPAAPRGGVSLCDVRDVAAGCLAALERGQPGRQYILAGHNMSYFSAWRLFAEVSSGRPPWMQARPPLTTLAGWCGDWVARFTGKEPDVNSASVRMAHLWHHYSSRRAADELGYHCRAARETVADAWQWFTEQGYV